METTIVYWAYIGIMEKKMGTTIVLSYHPEYVEICTRAYTCEYRLVGGLDGLITWRSKHGNKWENCTNEVERND